MDLPRAVTDTVAAVNPALAHGRVRRRLLSWQSARRLLIMAGIAYGAWLWLDVMRASGSGWDAHAYWAAPLADPYRTSAAGARDAYLYAPAFRQFLAPVLALPWPMFLGLWEALLIGTVILLTGPLAVFVLAIWPVPFEITAGNIHILLAAAIVVGFRWPAAWSALLLTKVTPGIGLLWFAVRREWRNLGVALGATLAIALVSFALAPGLWWQWVDVLVRNASAPESYNATLWQPPLILRLAVATVLVVAGAVTNRRWTVPVAATFALPLLAEINLVMLVGAVPLIAPEAGAIVRRLLSRGDVAGTTAT